MRRRFAYLLAPLAALGIGAGIISGCGQAIGEKCQIDSDCTSGLCNSGTGLCQAQNAGDAAFIPPPDAHPDAGPIDATPPPVDAKPIDAMPPDA